jgi:hypothetical protein
MLRPSRILGENLPLNGSPSSGRFQRSRLKTLRLGDVVETKQARLGQGPKIQGCAG